MTSGPETHRSRHLGDDWRTLALEELRQQGGPLPDGTPWPTRIEFPLLDLGPGEITPILRG